MNILYEDKWIICINKPAGTPVQPDKSNDYSLLDEVEEHFKTKLYLLNRIDRPVSGIVIFAKTKDSAKIFSRIIQDQNTIKTYYAITENTLTDTKGILTDYLIKKNHKAYITKSKSVGKKAILQYEYVGNSINYYYYKIQLKTGRFHQIRAQFSNRHCYIKGDVKYGAKRAEKDRSICLHAYELSFYHPYLYKQITIKAELPDKNIWKGALCKKINI